MRNKTKSLELANAETISLNARLCSVDINLYDNNCISNNSAVILYIFNVNNIVHTGMNASVIRLPRLSFNHPMGNYLFAN